MARVSTNRSDDRVAVMLRYEVLDRARRGHAQVVPTDEVGGQVVLRSEGAGVAVGFGGSVRDTHGCSREFRLFPCRLLYRRRWNRAEGKIEETLCGEDGGWWEWISGRRETGVS